MLVPQKRGRLTKKLFTEAPLQFFDTCDGFEENFEYISRLKISGDLENKIHKKDWKSSDCRSDFFLRHRGKVFDNSASKNNFEISEKSTQQLILSTRKKFHFDEGKNRL